MRVVVNGDGASVVGDDVLEAHEDGDGKRVTRIDAGGNRSSFQGAAVTLAKVLELANVPPDLADEVDVPKVATSGDVRISGDEVRDGFTGDPSGEVLFAQIVPGSTVRFIRPLRDTPGDTNGDDWVDVVGTLTLNVKTTNDARRSVVASVDDDTPNPGETVGFDARVQDPPAGVRFRYSWDWGDGTSAPDAQAPSRAFPKGHYQVTVTAVGDDGSVGVSDPIELQVGPVDAGPTATPAPGGAGPTVGGGSGGTGSGGGAKTGGGKARNGGTTSGPSRSSGRHTTAKPGATATATPAATATAPPAATTAPSTTITRSHGRTTTTRSPAPKAKSGTNRSTRDQPPASGGGPARSVDGVLLAGTGSAAEVADLLAGAEKPVPTAARRGGGGGSSPLAPAGGTLAVLALLGLGALRESGRHLRLPRLRG